MYAHIYGTAKTGWNLYRTDSPVLGNAPVLFTFQYKKTAIACAQQMGLIPWNY
jgi:hypothetical protein